MNCMEKMRTALLTLGSLLLTLTVVGNAYYQKKHFYPSAVYITKSNPSMAVLYIQAFIFVILMGKLMSKIFFGSLRASEFEHLIERFWYAVTETCLAFTVFRDDFSPKFVALFTLLLFLKAFHWLAEDRVDFMERSPVITFLFHFRVVCLLSTLSFIDSLFVNHAYVSTLSKGPSVQLVFGFEYAILLMVAGNIAIKYILHTIDLTSQNPWENKAVFLLYTEVFIGFFKVLLYVVFVIIMVRIHTFPLFAIRPMYLTLRAFKKALHDVIMSRRAIRNMNTLYQNATEQDLANTDNVCIICREEMNAGGGAKKLPCGHIFHSSCLRSWFQRQQTCPTCRMDVLRTPGQPAPGGQTPPQPQQQAQQPQQQQQQNQQPPLPNFPVPPANLFAGLFGQMPPAPPPPFPGTSQQATGSTPGTSGTGTTTTPTMPPFPFIPYMVPPPMPPTNLVGLTDEELGEMEGRERRNVEARIECLRNIQTLLDAAMLHMNQYSAIISTLNVAPPPPPPAAASSNGAGNNNNVNSKAENTENHSEETRISDPEQSNKEEESSAEGAVGYSDDRDEVRRRRLERFTEPTN